jgi:histidine triad (HIT) family protein
VRGEDVASVAYSDDDVVVFMDAQPVNPGHMLVVPRVHATQLSELPERVGARLFVVAMRVSEAVRQSGVKCEGVNLYLADGESAGQEVMHVHLHVIPRFRGDGHHLRFHPGYGYRPGAEELDRVAGEIRKALR